MPRSIRPRQPSPTSLHTPAPTHPSRQPQRRARSLRGHASRPLPARPPPPSRPTPALAALALWPCNYTRSLPLFVTERDLL